MPEELGTKDVLGQIDARLGNVEQDVRDLRVEMKSGFERVDQRFERIDERFDRMDQRFERIDERFDRMDQRFERVDQRFVHFDGRFETQARWVVGLFIGTWLTTIASIWLKP